MRVMKIGLFVLICVLMSACTQSRAAYYNDGNLHAEELLIELLAPREETGDYKIEDASYRIGTNNMFEDNNCSSVIGHKADLLPYEDMNGTKRLNCARVQAQLSREDDQLVHVEFLVVQFYGSYTSGVEDVSIERIDLSSSYYTYTFYEGKYSLSLRLDSTNKSLMPDYMSDIVNEFRDLVKE